MEKHENTVEPVIEQEETPPVANGDLPLNIPSATSDTPTAALPSQTSKKDTSSGFRKFIRKHSLKLAGVFNFIGDMALLKDGMKSGEKSQLAGGGLYTAGAVNLTVYGSENKSRTVREVTERTAEFIRNTTGELSPESKLHDVLGKKRDGVLSKANKFLYRHCAQNTLALYTGGAVAMLQFGIKRYKKSVEAVKDGTSKKADWGILGYAISSLVIKVLSLIIPEKSVEDIAKDNADAGAKRSKKNAIGRFVDWIREKPLRLFGYGSLVTEVMMLRAAFEDKKKDRHGFYSKLAVGTSYIIADLLAAISSKDPTNAEGRLDGKERAHLAGMAAESIADRPEGERVGLADQVAEFLAKQPEIGGKKEEFKKIIAERLHQVKDSLWADRSSAAPAGAEFAMG